MNVFDLQAILTLNSSNYTKGLSKAQSAAKSFAKAGAIAFAAVGTAAVATGAAIVKNTGDVASYGDNIDKMSQKMGISAKAYQEWDAILQHSGASISSLKTSMRVMSQQAQKNAEEFQKLGISQREVANLSQEDLFSKVIAGLQNMEEGTERTAIASKLLGRGAIELGALLNTSAEETEAMRQKVHELGGVMSDEAVKASAKYQDTLQDMKTATASVKRNLVADFLPSVTTVMEGVTDIITGKTDEGVAKISDGAKKIIENITKKVPEVIGKVSALLSKLMPDFVNLGVNLVSSLVGGFLEALPEITKESKTILPQIFGVVISGIKEIASLLPEIIPDIVDAITEIITELTKQLPDLIKVLLPAIIKGSIQLVISIVKNLPAIIKGLIDALPQVIGAIIEGLQPLVEGIGQLFANIWEGLKTFFQPVVDFFSNVFNNVKSVIMSIWQKILDIFRPVVQFFSGLFLNVQKTITSVFTNAWQGVQNVWNGVVGFFKGIWQGIQNVFGGIANWFGNIFRTAWEAVKNVFSAGGRIFEGIKDGILGALKNVINGLINGINWVIAQPFNGLNWALRGIKSLRIGDWQPFAWINELPVPQIPTLAEGGVLKRGQIALLEGEGDEAVIPLSKNTEWIDMVAERLGNQQAAGNTFNFNISIANMDANSQDDIESLAETLMQIMAEKTSRRGAAYG